MEMQTKINKRLFVLLALSIFITSCNDKHFFDEFQSTGSSWKQEDIKKFTFQQTDTISSYDMFINIRNNSSYPFGNIYLIAKVFAPDGKAQVDTLQYQMANPDGTLLGNGFTDTKESKLWFRENYRFKKAGVYTIELEHAIRKVGDSVGVSELEGVTDIGFRIEKK